MSRSGNVVDIVSGERARGPIGHTSTARTHHSIERSRGCRSGKRHGPPIAVCDVTENLRLRDFPDLLSAPGGNRPSYAASSVLTALEYNIKYTERKGTVPVRVGRDG